MDSITIQLNGKAKVFTKTKSLKEIVEELKVNPKKVAIAKNLEIVLRSKLEETFLEDGDEIEIFHAVGGG